MASEVEIFGRRYTLRSEAGEEHVKQVAEMVDARMREVAGAGLAVSPLQAAVLAALHLASELQRAEAETARLAAHVEARAEALNSRIRSLVPEVSRS